MNPKVGGSSPPQVETFSVSKTLTLSQEHPFVSKMNAAARAHLTFQMSIFLQNIYIARTSIQQHGTTNVWPWQLNRLEHSAWIWNLGVRVPLSSIHFLSQKCCQIPRNTRSRVENECCCPRTVNISNVEWHLNCFGCSCQSLNNRIIQTLIIFLIYLK